MEQKTKDLLVRPFINSLVVELVLGVCFIVWSGWYNGVPFHNPLSWMKDALFARVPVWVALIVVALAAILAGLMVLQRAHTEEERFDVFSDFSIDMNPTGRWLYGSSSALEGPITLFATKLPGILDGRADKLLNLGQM
jgi:hypothetical protein